jgi:hypothetical protein
MRTALAVLAVALAATAALAIAGWPANSYLHNDFAGFWAGGRALLEGSDPYDWPTWAALHERIGSRGTAIVPRETPFGYPLVTAVAVAPFALLPVPLAAPAWLVAQVLAALVGVRALGIRVLGASARRDLPVVLAIGGASQPAWVLAEGGNVGGFLLGIVAGALALLLAGRPFAAGALLGALAIKPHPFLWFVPLLLLAVPRRQAIAVAAGGALTTGALLLVSFALRPGWLASWLGSVQRIQSVPVSRANALGLAPAEAGWLGWALVALLAVALVLWWRTRHPPLVALAAGALSLSLFGSPYVWSYDHLVLVVGVLAAVAFASRAESRERTPLLALIAAAFVPLPWLLYALAFSRGDEAWNALVPVALFAVLVLAERRVPLRDSQRPGQRDTGPAASARSPRDAATAASAYPRSRS